MMALVEPGMGHPRQGGARGGRACAPPPLPSPMPCDLLSVHPAFPSLSLSHIPRRTHAHSPSLPPPPLSSLQIEAMTSETLEVALQARDRPMVIDFYATWCGPCLLMAKELEKVAAEMGKAVRIVKLDVDANPDIASQV